MHRQNVKERILAMVEGSGEVSNGEVGRLLGLTRQGVHHHLKQLVESGDLVLVGGGRGARYRRPGDRLDQFSFPAVPEAMHDAWLCVGGLPWMGRRPPALKQAMRCAVTELVGNAVEHADAAEIRVRAGCLGPRLVLEVSDDGVGLFARIAQHLGLDSFEDAARQLSKGQLSTRPGHAGEGIGVLARLGQDFSVESGGIEWIRDEARQDESIGPAPRRRGTQVRMHLSRDATPNLSLAVESARQRRVRVALFESGGQFLSRAEARALAAGLEAADSVVLDFAEVRRIGLGFADELFRDWSRRHPQTQLVVANVAPHVARVIEASRRAEGTQYGLRKLPPTRAVPGPRNTEPPASFADASSRAEVAFFQEEAEPPEATVGVSETDLAQFRSRLSRLLGD